MKSLEIAAVSAAPESPLVHDSRFVHDSKFGWVRADDEYEPEPGYDGEAEIIMHTAEDGIMSMGVIRPGDWVRVSLPVLEELLKKVNRLTVIKNALRD